MERAVVLGKRRLNIGLDRKVVSPTLIAAARRDDS